MSQPKSLDNPHEMALREWALAYPETHEDFPWGHRVIKVKGKAFIFMGHEHGGLGLSVKLPHSNAAALMMPFATPTGYGLGKSGWVSADFPEGQKPPMEMLRQWLDESFRAVAPKKLVAQLGGAVEKAPAVKKAPAAKKAAAKKSAAVKRPAARKKVAARAKQAR
jgi:predicted DNA-binding protein (MmcQ/YjbR family)